MGMKTLIVGNGAREHAIAWALAASRHEPELLIAPGNAGTARLGRNVPISAEDIPALIAFAKSESVELTVVGPEAPLAAGIVDRFAAAGLAAFGPTAAAARIESSKRFAKWVMAQANAPTARAIAFTDYESAMMHVMASAPPFVIKADGLAAGKGVTVARDVADARDALREMFLDRAFGAAGDTALVEEYMEGRELSVFAFVDGSAVSEFAVACDYKRARDGDAGPNTGGMGSYGPPPFWDDDLEREARARIMQPVADRMVELGCPFRGILYAGLMLTDDGPRVVEFNCRMGDPEAQVVLPRLETDLMDIILAAMEGDLSSCQVRWSSDPWVGVVMASDGYPGAYDTGREITGIPPDGDGRDHGRVVFHAGSDLRDDGVVVTSGGRVLTASARGETIADARENAYALADSIAFDNAYYRTDIAKGI